MFYYTAKDSSNQTERFAVSVTVTHLNGVLLPAITVTPDESYNFV